MLAVPAATFGVTAAWTTRTWSLAMTGTRADDWINYDRVALTRAALAADNLVSDKTVAPLRSFWRPYDGMTQLSVRATRALRPNVSLIFTGENLLDRQIGAPDNMTILPGRGLSVGVRASF